MSGPSVGLTRNRAAALVGLAVLLAVAWAFRDFGLATALGLSAKADTTKYAILPVEADSSLPASESYDRLHQAFAGWSGIQVASRFDVREARGSDAPVSSDREAVRVSKELAAGRYVRARLVRAGPDLSLSASISDLESRSTLVERVVTLPRDQAQWQAAFDRLARSLLLRSADSIAVTSRTLPAAQLYVAGIAELRAFRLTRADSLLAGAVELDRGFGPGAFWLAQERAWRLGISGVERWLPWAERAVAASGLDAREATLAHALVALGRRDLAKGCANYRALIARNDKDFAAWYGLGQCLHWDQAVIRDARTKSGWRFRSSYHQAVRAYTRAFEIAPSTLQNFEPHAFNELRTLLFAGRAILKAGAALPPDTTRFRAQASWAGDSLVFVPFPAAVFWSGAALNDPSARARATLEQQRLFARIARSWATAFPRNASAKEAVAVAMEMTGEPGALDTLRAARSLAESDAHRLRLAAEEVLLRISIARRVPAAVTEVPRLADSLLDAHPSPTREQAAILGPLASLRGQCGRAGSLAARAAEPSVYVYEVPGLVAAAAESVTVLAAMGCPTSGVPFDDMVKAVTTTSARASTDRDGAEYALLGRAYALMPTIDTVRLGRMARHSGDYLLRAQYGLVRSDSALVRQILERRRQTRGSAGTTDVTPDAVFPETMLWLSLGDTVIAQWWPDPMLNRASLLELLLNEPIPAGSLVRLAQLRVELARMRGDTAVLNRWSPLLQQLRRGADPQLLPPSSGVRR